MTRRNCCLWLQDGVWCQRQCKQHGQRIRNKTL